MLSKPIAVFAAVTAVLAGAGWVVTSSWPSSPRVILLSCEDYASGRDANSDRVTQAVDLAECAGVAVGVKNYWDVVREGMRPPTPEPKTLTPEQLNALTNELRRRPGFGPIQVPGEPGEINPGDIPKIFAEARL
jgi:hypothetical protein